MQKIRVGIIGCGAISPAYLSNLTTCFSAVLDVVACADLNPELATKRATEFGIGRVCSTSDLLAAPDIDLTVFQQQIARLGKSIRVSVFVSRADRALSLSSRIAGDRQRVGAMDPTKPRDADALQRLGVRVYVLSSFSDGFIGHGVYADAPDVIRSIGAQLAEPR